VNVQREEHVIEQALLSVNLILSLLNFYSNIAKHQGFCKCSYDQEEYTEGNFIADLGHDVITDHEKEDVVE